MDLAKKEKIRPYVRDIIYGFIDSSVNDIFSDGYIRNQIWDSMPDDIVNDEEIEDLMFNGDDSGSFSEEPLEKLVDELTDSFMGRFDNE